MKGSTPVKILGTAFTEGTPLFSYVVSRWELQNKGLLRITYEIYLNEGIEQLASSAKVFKRA